MCDALTTGYEEPKGTTIQNAPTSLEWITLFCVNVDENASSCCIFAQGTINAVAQ